MATLKTLKKGDKVILCTFTGMKVGVFEISTCSEKSITITKKNGDKGVFSRKTGHQTNIEEGKERFASFIIEDDGSYVAPNTLRKSKEIEKAKESPVTKKKAKKEPEPEPEDYDEDEDEEEEEEVKPKKKATAKKAPAKKSKKIIEEDEYEDAE